MPALLTDGKGAYQVNLEKPSSSAEHEHDGLEGERDSKKKKSPPPSSENSAAAAEQRCPSQ